MATLLNHADTIRSEFREAFADKVVTAQEAFRIAGSIVDAVKCTYEKAKDDSQFNQLVTEAEELYDELANPENYDIPRVPEVLERAIYSAGRMFVRTAIAKLCEAVDEVS